MVKYDKIAIITERQSQLLDFIIRQHIKTAEPVGSVAVTESGKFAVSSATVRNDMQGLEELGLLVQPHTSAGRVPTDRAYRYFIDELMKPDECIADTKARRRIEEALKEADPSDLRGINRLIAQALSDISDTAVISNVGQSPDFYKTGLSGLFEFPEFHTVDRMFHMTIFFDRFDEMFDRIEQEFFGVSGKKHESRFSDGITVSIGRENPFRDLRDGTLICGQYRLPYGYGGTFTMIGPVRMNYGKNVGAASYAIECLNVFADATA